MKQVISYESTGYIVCVEYNPAEYIEPVGEDYITTLVDEQEIYHPDTHYFDLEEGIVKRLKVIRNIPTSVSETEDGWEILLSDVPTGSKVTWPDDETTIVSDGVIECEVNLEGEYTFLIEHVAHFPKEVVVNVQA